MNPESNPEQLTYQPPTVPPQQQPTDQKLKLLYILGRIFLGSFLAIVNVGGLIVVGTILFLLLFSNLKNNPAAILVIVLIPALVISLWIVSIVDAIYCWSYLRRDESKRKHTKAAQVLLWISLTILGFTTLAISIFVTISVTSNYKL